MKKTRYSYVTLLSSNDYVIGVVMLYLSLQKVKTEYSLFVLCSDILSQKSMKILDKFRIHYKFITNHINVDTTKVNTDEGYDHWNRTFDKIHIWTLTEFDKVVYLDSDMQVIRNIDYLFDVPHMSAVIADQWNEPGLMELNSGLMVITPNIKEYNNMKRMWESGVIKLKNVGDQDVIRAYYKDWNKQKILHLDPGLNVFYSEVSTGIIKKENVQPVSVIHYIGSRKPWMVSLSAILNRMKHNFLWKHLLFYACMLYFYFPKCIIPQRFR